MSLIGDLPEDTTLDDNGYIPYSENGQELHKMKVKNFIGGTGLKFWKETEDTFYRVQRNDGEWLFDNFFTVPGGAQIITGSTYWDFEPGGADHDSSDPIIIEHEPDQDHQEAWTEELPGPEIAYLQGLPKHYYIFRRLSSKPCMGGYLMWKYWDLDGESGSSRMAEDSIPSQQDPLPTHRLTQNLVGWLLMSTDREDCIYQVVEIDPWHYEDMPATVQVRIDNGFFRWVHSSDNVLMTVSPSETTITHEESGAVFYINTMPDPTVYEPLVIKRAIGEGDYSWYTNVGGDCLLGYIDDDSHFQFWQNSDTTCPSDSAFDTYQTSTTPDSSDNREDWHGNGNILSSLVGRKRVYCLDYKLYSKTQTATSDDIFSTSLAYLGTVYNSDGIDYDGTDGKDAVSYLFHDAQIMYPPGYFTAIATGFGEDGKTFYSGMMTSNYDTPRPSDANYSVDKDGNIEAKSIDVDGAIKLDGSPFIKNVSRFLNSGTKIATVYSTDDDVEPLDLYAPTGGGGGSVAITATRLWQNTKAGSQTQVSSAQLSEQIGNFDIIMFDVRDSYSFTTRSFKSYVYVDTLGFSYSDDSMCCNTYANNYVNVTNMTSGSTTTVYFDYSGAAFVKQIIGIKYT